MSRPAASVRHLREPEPIDFPTEAEVPEELEHFALRALLFDSLSRAFEGYASIGSDQFVYWNGSDPTRCLAPDAFVFRGPPQGERFFRSWKTWERGTPQTAVEIVSVFDRSGVPHEQKLARYRELGVRELVGLRLAERAPSGVSALVLGRGANARSRRCDPPRGRLRGIAIVA